MSKIPACKILILALVVILTGCAGSGVRTWDSTLNGFKGKPINDADIVFGHPDGEYTKNGVTTYVWQDHKTESVFGPSVTSGRGYRLGSPLNSGNEFLWSGIEVYTCVIRAGVVDGLITQITSEGNPGGCEIIHGFRHAELGHDYSAGRGHAL